MTCSVAVSLVGVDCFLMAHEPLQGESESKLSLAPDTSECDCHFDPNETLLVVKTTAPNVTTLTLTRS